MRADRISSVRPNGVRHAFRATALIILGAILLMWPTAVNRGPFFFSDTTAYLRGADAAAHKLLGVSTDWTERFLMRYENQEESRPGTSAGGSGTAVTLAGRSVYYGAFLYVADQLGGLSLVPVIQSLLVALCLYLTVRRFFGRRKGSVGPFLALSAILSLASSVAFFTGFLMPDLFAGIAILAAAQLLMEAPPLTKFERAFWIAVLSWSALSHSSIIVLLMLIASAMLVSTLKWRVPSVRSLCSVGLAIAIGIVGEILFSGAVRSLTGDAPVRPPFLMARIIADGPGKEFLEENCPESGFALCRYKDGLGPTSDLLLWSADRPQGVFTALPNNERRRIASEETRFVIAVAADRPFEVFRSSLAAIADQAGKFRLSEFNQTPPETRELDAKLPPRVRHQYAATRAYSGEMPLRGIEISALLASAVSLLLILRLISKPGTDRNVRLFLSTLLIGVAANIAICGALSTPHDRYSTRVLWVLIVGAFVGGFGAKWSYSSPTERNHGSL